ncbi:MAG: hypothetical protein ACO3JL_13965, partial [Myxococcota bacterium]
ALRGSSTETLLRDAPGIPPTIKALPHAKEHSQPAAHVTAEHRAAVAGLGDAPARYFDQAERVAESGRSPGDPLLASGAMWRAPVGEYGEALALALVDANRVMMRETHVVAAATAESAAYEQATRLNVAGSLCGTWEQGIEALSGAVSLLTSKRVQGKSADEVLASLADGSALLQLASRAAAFSVEPIVGAGYLSKEPLQVTDNGKGRLPKNLLAYSREVHESREDFSAEATSDYARHHMRAGDWMANETKRGCPLAAKVPIYNEHGTLQVPDHTAIERLGAEYIALVRHFLKDRLSAAE